jgi:membrane protein involved in colicin uptake
LEGASLKVGAMIVVKVKKRRFKIGEVPTARWMHLREALSQQRRRAKAFVSPPAVAATARESPSARATAEPQAAAEVDEPAGGEAAPVAVDEEALPRMRADLQRLQERKTELFTMLKEVLAEDEERRRTQAAQCAKARADSEATERRAAAANADDMPAGCAAPIAMPPRGPNCMRGPYTGQQYPGGAHTCGAGGGGSGADELAPSGRHMCGYGPPHQYRCARCAVQGAARSAAISR